MTVRVTIDLEFACSSIDPAVIASAVANTVEEEFYVHGSKDLYPRSATLVSFEILAT